MSQFAVELDRLLAARKMPARDLSQACGVDNNKISRIRRGQTNIKPRDLADIIQHAGRNNAERAALLSAYLRDWLVSTPAVNSMIRITVNGAEPVKEVKLPKLAPDVEKAVTVLLREAPHNRRVQQALLSIADFLNG